MIMVWSKLLSIVFSDTALFPRFKEFLKNGMKLKKKNTPTANEEQTTTVPENQNEIAPETQIETAQTLDQPQALENNE